MPVWPGPTDCAAYHAPSVERPPLPESSLAEQALEQRREWGLPVDPESVRRAVENRERQGSEWSGWWRTPQEEFEESVFDRELPGRIRGAAADHGAEIGGVALVWLNGKRAVEISLKGEVDRYREVLGKQFGTDRLIVRQACFSERDLVEQHEQIPGDASELEELGI